MLQFVQGAVYTIQNAGCGRQKVFFQKRNYQYFKKKMQQFLLPYAEILNYQLKVNEVNISIRIKQLYCYIPKYKRIRSLAESIGIMLRSYAQAINKQENRKGVLWQGPTEAILQERIRIQKVRNEKPINKKQVLYHREVFEAAGKKMQLPLNIETLRRLSRLGLGVLTSVIKLKQLYLIAIEEGRRRKTWDIDWGYPPFIVSQSA